MSTVLRANRRPMAVKNLGWLLRNWANGGGIEYIGFNYSPSIKTIADGELIVKFCNGDVYMTDYASIYVGFSWLDRPVFKGCEFRIVDIREHSRPQKTFTIGNDEYKAIKKMTYEGMKAAIIPTV